jgi:hypothetical protein
MNAHDEAAAIVPFGKYKGQPVEVMMADRDYCSWAMAQAGLRARFASVFAIIVNGGTAPDAQLPSTTVSSQDRPEAVTPARPIAIRPAFPPGSART